MTEQQQEPINYEAILAEIKQRNTQVKHQLQQMSADIADLIQTICHPPPGCDDA